MKSVTVAGIDCGTNSIRLKVSRVSEDGVEDIVPRILRVIRLGAEKASGGWHSFRCHFGHS